MKFSYSSMASWRRCRYRYFLQYVGNYLTPPSRAQRIGKAGHAGLHAWYTTGSEEKTMQAALDSLMYSDELYKLEFNDEYDQIRYILKRYLRWSIENDNFAIKMYKDKPAIEVRLDCKIGSHDVVAYLDGVVVVVEDREWVLEHKFVSRVETKHIDLDLQAGTYMLMGIKSGINLQGVYYNFVRTTAGGKGEEEPVVRLPTYRNREGLAIIEAEMEGQLDEMQNFLSKGGKIYRNCTKDCSWDCGFFEVCLSVNDNGDADSILRSFEKYNPDKEQLYGKEI